MQLMLPALAVRCAYAEEDAGLDGRGGRARCVTHDARRSDDGGTEDCTALGTVRKGLRRRLWRVCHCPGSYLVIELGQSAG